MDPDPGVEDGGAGHCRQQVARGGDHQCRDQQPADDRLDEAQERQVEQEERDVQVKIGSTTAPPSGRTGRGAARGRSSPSSPRPSRRRRGRRAWRRSTMTTRPSGTGSGRSIGLTIDRLAPRRIGSSVPTPAARAGLVGGGGCLVEPVDPAAERAAAPVSPSPGGLSRPASHRLTRRKTSGDDPTEREQADLRPEPGPEDRSRSRRSCTRSRRSTGRCRPRT